MAKNRDKGVVTGIPEIDDAEDFAELGKPTRALADRLERLLASVDCDDRHIGVAIRPRGEDAFEAVAQLSAPQLRALIELIERRER